MTGAGEERCLVGTSPELRVRSTSSCKDLASAACSAGDPDGGGHVTMDEILTAVNNFLGGGAEGA